MDSGSQIPLDLKNKGRVENKDMGLDLAARECTAETRVCIHMCTICFPVSTVNFKELTLMSRRKLSVCEHVLALVCNDVTAFPEAVAIPAGWDGVGEPLARTGELILESGGV